MKRFLQARFELSAGPGRIVPLEGMRGLAALLVFLVHFHALFGHRIAPGSRLDRIFLATSSFGHTGVDLFFLLSGFLMYGIVIRWKSSYGQYLSRRFKRLYPVFTFVLALYIGLSWLFPQASKLPSGIGQAVVYIAANLAMLPGIFPIIPIITVAWSLSYEWLFYLTLPLLIGGLRLRNWRWWQRILLFLLAAGLIAGASPYIRLIMFASGIILWEILNRDRAGFKLPAWGEYLVIAAFCANLMAIGIDSQKYDVLLLLSKVPSYYSPTLFVSMFFLTMYAVAFQGILQRIFSWDYLRWMGNISYSYYLIHGLTLHGIRYLLNGLYGKTVQSPEFILILFAVSLCATVLAAAVLYLCVEKPLSLGGRRPEPKVAPAPKIQTRVATF